MYTKIDTFMEDSTPLKKLDHFIKKHFTFGCFSAGMSLIDVLQ